MSNVNLNLTADQIATLSGKTSVMVVVLSAQDLAAVNAGAAVTIQGPLPLATPSGSVVTDILHSITDVAGNKWTITASAQVAVNGVTDIYTSGVKTLAYVNGVVWHQNKGGWWWGKTSPGAAWAPVNGTPTAPLAGH